MRALGAGFALVACLLLALSVLSSAAKLQPRSAGVPSRRAQSTPHKRAVKPTAKKRKAAVSAYSGDHDDDDYNGSGSDDGDDDDSFGDELGDRPLWTERASTRKVRAKKQTPQQKLVKPAGKAPKPSSLGALMKWSQRSLSPDQPSIREKMSSVLTSVATRGRELARFAKAHVSSAYEQALLAATWPDDMPVTPEQARHVLSRVHKVADIVDTLPPKDNPYRTTLHKLWTKMCEKDWRTTIKALYLLHYVVRETRPDDSAMLMMNIRRMSNEINRKAAPMHYFNLNQVENLDDKSEPYLTFITHYAVFVFKRAMFFTSKFEELKIINASTSADKAVHLLNRAITVAQEALSCTLPTKNIRNHITCQAVRQVATDLHEMWQSTCKALATLIQEGALSKSNRATINMLERFLDARPKVQGYLADTQKHLAPLRLRIPTDVPDEPSINIVERHLAELRRTQPAVEEAQAKYTDDAEQDDAEDDDDDDDFSGEPFADEEQFDDGAEDDSNYDLEAATLEDENYDAWAEEDEQPAEESDVDDANYADSDEFDEDFDADYDAE